MKRLLLVMVMVFSIGTLSAQTKTAYCDIYLRGGGLNLNATIAFDEEVYDYYNQVNIGEIINEFAAYGWVLDREIVIPRHQFFSMFTRHKLHFIMKKEYQEGEDPFISLKYMLRIYTDSDNIQVEVMSDNKYNVGDNIEYNGISAYIVYATDSQVVLAANGMGGTWNEAMAYCASMGEEWRLPSTEEFKKISRRLQNNYYWTCEEVNQNKAVYYACEFLDSYRINKEKKCYILPITIVDISELK